MISQPEACVHETPNVERCAVRLQHDVFLFFLGCPHTYSILLRVLHAMSTWLLYIYISNNLKSSSVSSLTPPQVEWVEHVDNSTSQRAHSEVLAIRIPQDILRVVKEKLASASRPKNTANQATERQKNRTMLPQKRKRHKQNITTIPSRHSRGHETTLRLKEPCLSYCYFV